jgi:pyruvate/2-oxoglutarate/acetoin dehydrogenase E1 component
MYKDELIKAMGVLAKDNRTIFLGQEIITNGFYKTMGEVPVDKMVELPIIEDVQMGMVTGLSLMGYVPISLYTRMDFIILAMNQLVNHLDKIENMTCGDFKPKVIIRTVVGEKLPMNCGPQHTQDFTEVLRCALSSIKVITLTDSDMIVPSYINALDYSGSTILVEYKEMYGK